MVKCVFYTLYCSVSYRLEVQYGATRREVRELEQFGRRLLFDQMSSYATTRGSFDTNGIDLKKLSGYGCYGSPLGIV